MGHKDNLLRIFLVLLLTMMSLINMKKSLMFPKVMSMMKKMTRRESERRGGRRRDQPRPSLTSLIPMTLLLVTTQILIKRYEEQMFPRGCNSDRFQSRQFQKRVTN